MNNLFTSYIFGCVHGLKGQGQCTSKSTSPDHVPERSASSFESLFENSLDPYLDGSIPAAWQRAAVVPHDRSFPYIPCRL